MLRGISHVLRIFHAFDGSAAYISTSVIVFLLLLVVCFPLRAYAATSSAFVFINVAICARYPKGHLAPALRSHTSTVQSLQETLLFSVRVDSLSGYFDVVSVVSV